MANVSIPILDQLVPGGFQYGQIILVVYEPDSLWYDTSLTMTALALKKDGRVEYHTYEHIPSEIRLSLSKFGVDVKRLEDEDRLRIHDSYTGQTGLGQAEAPAKSSVPIQPLKLSDSSIEFAQHIKAGIPESDKKILHIDDNMGTLLHYNDEKTVINFGRTRMVPWARARETTYLISILNGIASDAFYKQIGSYFDGIVDFKSEDKGMKVEQLARVRSIRGKKHDSRWHRLELLDNGEVALLD